ncbi:MAG: tetratricopeptide repeat protein [Chitinophagales bacterium]|nr:tetratricopeptide repeat protein [Chitinophagales bacterium]
MFRYILLFITVLSAQIPVFAQANADSLLRVLKTAKEDTNKANILNELSAVYFQTDPEKSKQYGKQVLELSTKLQWDRGILRGNNLVGRCNAVQNNLSEALKYFQNALVIARKIKSARYEGMMLSSISAVYASNNDYDKALDYALQAKKVNEAGGIKYMSNLMINIGFLYIRQSKFDEAQAAYEEALRNEKQYGTEETKGELASIYLNIGGVYIRKGLLPQALESYTLAANMLKALGHDSHLTYAYANLGEVYLRAAKGMSIVPLPDSMKNNPLNLEKSLQYLTLAEEMSKRLQLVDGSSEVAQSFANLYKLKGEYDKAYKYLEKHTDLKDTLYNAEKEKDFARIEAQFYVRRQTDSLNYLNKLKDKEIVTQKIQRNSAIGLVLLAGIISLLLINRQKLKHKQKTDMAIAEARRREELASLQLADFTRSIQEKNDLLEQFSAELEKYRTQQPNANEQAEKENSLHLLQRSVILNDEQWADFQALFNKVHTGYINRVKEKYPDLTTAELRSILLTKLGLNNKEMAAMLGVSLEAVRVSKHRLLKKISLPEDTKLEDWVNTI